MITVYNQQMQRVAILENAYKIGYSKEVNNLWTCWFSLPADDLKTQEVTAKRFLELYDHDKRIGMFQINPIKTVRSDDDKSITYNCEHVLATLHSDVLFGYYQYVNYTTRDVLEGLLAMQEVQRWVLGRCAFTRYFQYAWENEDSLLNATFSVPKPFDQSYQWTWDDSVYPWVLNLDEATNEIIDEIRYGKNLKGIEKDEDPTGIITRIYPKGYGEGVNQLGIEKVNPTGLSYIEAEAEYIDAYGIQKKIWVDKRFEDAESLYASAKAFLDKYKVPQVSYTVDCIDYEQIDPYKLTKYEDGKVVRVKDEEINVDVLERIMKITKNDINENPLDIQFEIGSINDDIGMTFTDLQKKQLVNETYSQGATNIDSHNYNDNCDAIHPAVIKFYLPDDLVNINAMTLSYETEKFRAYEQATKGGGATTATSSAGGGTTATSSAGGASTQTSSSGGGSTQTSSSGGGGTQTSSAGGGSTETTSTKTFIEAHLMSGVPENAVGTENYGNHLHEVVIPGDMFEHNHSISIPSHTHNVSIPSHTHDVSIPAHTHTVSIPAHTHDVTIPPHTHEVTIPDHVHEIDFGIYELDETATAVTVKVDGQIVVGLTTISASDFNLIPYLSKDTEGKVNRGQWHTVEIFPDKLARINANIISRLFIQSRIGGTF